MSLNPPFPLRIRIGAVCSVLPPMFLGMGAVVGVTAGNPLPFGLGIACHALISLLTPTLRYWHLFSHDDPRFDTRWSEFMFRSSPEYLRSVSAISGVGIRTLSAVAWTGWAMAASTWVFLVVHAFASPPE